MSFDVIRLPFKETPRPAPPRQRASFAGASQSRLTSNWQASLQSADRELRGSLRTLRARSRDLSRNNPHVAGFVAALKDNVVGPSGIGVNPRLMTPRGKPMKRETLAVWQAWQRWQTRQQASADGALSWPMIQRLVLGTWVVDGEVLLRRLPGFENDFGYALQFLDADQLDETYNQAPGLGRPEITQGVEIDRWGRAVAYHLWEGHPGEVTKRRRVRVSADEIIHLFVPLRPNQHRGLPLLTPALMSLRLVEGYTEAEVVAAWVAAAQGGFFTITGEDAQALGAGSTDDEDAPIELEAEPGLARKLPPGWKFDQWDPSHPNSTFPDFQKAMLRTIARAVNGSYITLSGDLSDTSYSSGRQGLITERDTYKTMQQWLGEELITPVYRDVIRYGSLAGAIPLPTPEASKWSDMTLEPRGWPWVDPQNDAETAQLELRSLLNSPQRICAARGLDYEQLLDEIKEAQDMAAERGIDWPTFDAKPAAAEPPAPQPTPAAHHHGNGNGNRLAREPLLPFEGGL